MESFKFQKSYNDQARLSGIEVSGMLVVENSEQLKKELIDVFDSLSEHVKITITGIDEIDLSCIQLIVAFIIKMEDARMSFELNWNIDEDQRSFLVNVGLSKELFISSLYA